MHWLGPDIAVELASRVIATALIVIGITLAVERLGPRLGGGLAGLPIVIGPGFFFLIRENDAAFSADAAAYSLLSLCATEVFLLGYCAAAARLSAGLSLLAASAAWLAVAFLLSNMPPWPVPGLLLFLAVAIAARRTARRFLSAERPRSAKPGASLLVARGFAAGVLVAVATLAADQLGSGWSGFLMTFPIGFSVVSITVHQRSGPATAIATLHAGMVGVASLAAFSFTLSVMLAPFGSALAYAGALAAGLGVTGAITWHSARSLRRAREAA